ncbi:MAG: hypothetical protein E7112_03450 [Bacteroidales bacterium]|nr:hypothetical protein [Bacteroidales bacterium]
MKRLLAIITILLAATSYTPFVPFVNFVPFVLFALYTPFAHNAILEQLRDQWQRIRKLEALCNQIETPCSKVEH